MATLLDYALTNLADVKESLNLDSGDHSQDNLIVRKINQATEMIEHYCDRRFLLTTYTDEEYDSTNIDQLILLNRPVTEVTRLQVRDTTLNQNDWETVDAELYFLDSKAGVLDLNFRANGRWNRWRITYSAGYATIPSDLAEACATLAAYYVQNPSTGQVVKVKEEGQRRIEYYDSQGKDDTLFEQLGISHIVNQYANLPILADK